MSRIDIKTILKQVEELLASAGVLPAEAALAVEMLLNVVEALCSDRIELTDEVERLRKQLEKKKVTVHGFQRWSVYCVNSSSKSHILCIDL